MELISAFATNTPEALALFLECTSVMAQQCMANTFGHAFAIDHLQQSIAELQLQAAPTTGRPN